MSVYDKAHELARAVSQSREYSELISAFEKIKNDEKAKQMYKDFRKKQIEVQLDEMSGKNTDEKAKQLENLYQVLSYNNDIKNLLEAEEKFAILAADIQQILNKSLDFDLENW